MNKFATLFLLALAYSIPTKAEKVDRILDINPNSLVTITSRSGEIGVRSWNKPQIRIRGEIGQGLIDVDTKRDIVVIDTTTKNKAWGSSGREVDFIVTVPKQVRLDLNGFSTSMRIDGIDGAINMTTISGDLSLLDAQGKHNLRTVSGDIDIENVSGQLNVESVSGDIRVDANVNELLVKTVSGDIQTSLKRIDDLEISTVSGQVEARFRLNDEGRVSARSISGDIDLNFTEKQIDARFDINTGPGGRVRNALSEDKPKKDRYALSSQLQFWLGKGKAQVELQTMSGTIKLEN